MRDIWQDAARTVRTLARQPAFSLVAILTLTLGIGATTAIFSVVNAVMLRPLKAPDAASLVRFVTTTRTSTTVTGAQTFDAWRQQSQVVEDVSAHRLEYVNLTDGSEPELIPVARVSADFFHVFRAPLQNGRAFTPSDDRPGAPPVAVLSHTLWTRRFQQDPAAIGRQILLGNHPHLIVGVLADAFDTEQFEPQPDAWVPFQIDADRVDAGNLFTVTGRLTAGTTHAAANAALAVAAAREHPPDRSGTPTIWTVEPLDAAMVGTVRSSLTLLLVAVTLLLIVACVNVASLLLVRADVRNREMAIRTALGAGRRQIVRQLLTESVVLALISGALGLVTGSIGVRALLTMYPGANPFRLGDVTAAIPRIGAGGASVTVDWRVFAFAVAASVVTGVFFGLAPALHAARVDLVSAMKRTTAGGPGRPARVRGMLVAIEVALALMLAAGAALLIRSSAALRAVDAGFDAGHVVTMRTSLAATRFETRDGIAALTRDVSARIRAVPGVVSATAACCMPLETVWQLPFVVSGRPPESLTRAGALAFTGFAGWTFVAPGYFDVLRVPILRGRDFTDRDTADAPGVVVINEEMARRFWPGGDPLNDRLIIGKGMRREYDQEPLRQIVGIVGNVRDTALTRPARPAMYVPMAQEPDGVTALNVRLLPIVWMARTAADPLVAAAPIERAVRDASGLPVARVRSMAQVVAESRARSRFDTWLMTVFGACALLLAAVGVYGLTAYSVQLRTAEIGIRLALGADARAVRNLVLRHGMMVAGIGAALGLAAALAFARVLSGFLFGVTPHDPLVFALVTAVLLITTFVAVWLPARRATRLDPLTALRQE